MRRGARLLGWIVAAAGMLLVIGMIAAVIVIHTARFKEFLRVQIVNYLNHNYRGQFAIGSIKGSLLGALSLRDVSVRLDDSPVLSVPLVRLHYQLSPLAGGLLNVTLLSIEGPTLHLARLSDGDWNLLAALSNRNPSPHPAPAHHGGLAVRLDQLSLERGDISVSESPSRTYRLQDAHVEADAEVGSSGVRADVNQLGARITAPGFPDTSLDGGLTYNEIGVPGGSIRIPALSLKTQNSSLSLAGAVSNLKAKSVDATLTINRLAAADVNAVVPQAGLAQDLSGKIRIAGDSLAALRIEAQTSAGNSHLDAHAQANLAQSPLIYTADAQLKDLNLRELLKPADGRMLPGGVISGTVRASGRGTDLAGLIAATDLQDKGVSTNGFSVDDLSLKANFEKQVATINAALASGKGRARLDGKIDTAGPIRYRLRLAVSQLELKRAAGKLNLRPGNLNLNADVQGSGLDPSKMNTSASVSMERSVIGPVTIDSAKIDARIAGGVVRIANGNIKAQQSTVSVKGDVAIAGEQRASLRYSANVQSLTPWLAIVGRQGGGSVNLAGDAEGNLRRLRVSGSGNLLALHLDKYSVNKAHLTYDLDGIGKPGAIRGQLTIALAKVGAGIELKALSSEVRLQPGRASAQLADITVNVTQTDSHTGALSADVDYQPQRISVNLTRLSLATEAGNWRLSHTAAIVRDRGTLSVRGFQVVSAEERVSIEGSLSDDGGQNLSVAIDSLRLATLSALMPQAPRVQGLLSAQLKATGTAAAPGLALTAKLDALQIEGIRYQSVSANFGYAETRASLAIAFQQDVAHRLDARGELPLRLSWNQGFQYAIVGDLNLEAKSSGLDLTFLDAFAAGSVSQVRGTLSLDLTAHGPIRSPQPNGFVELSGGRAFLKPLNVKIKNAAAKITLAPNEVRLANLSVAAQGGTISGSGAINLASGAPGQADLKITFDKWPAIKTSRYQATIAGVIGCSGPLSALQVKGRTEVLYGVLRPELDLMGGESLKPDHTIKVSDSWAPPPQAPRPQKKATSGFGVPALDSVAINMDVVIDRNTWIKTAEGAVELEGKIHIYQAPHGKPSLSGAIKTVHGNLSVVGKNFTLTQGVITFTGGQQIDPSLDIAADYVTPGYDVTVTISGTAKKPVLALSSTPSLTQSDILAVLMFGKPMDQLTSSQQSGLQQQALSMAGGYAAAQVGQSIAQALGLESLGVDMSQSGAVGFGNYLTHNVYVSANQSTTSGSGSGASLNYYLTPHLELDTSASTNTSVGNQVELNWKMDY